MKKMKKVFVYSMLCLLGIAFSSCEKINDNFCSVQKAINAISDKESATTLTIEGELTSEDIRLISDIKSQLPKISTIVLTSATSIPDMTFAIKEGIAWKANTWLTSIKAPNVKSVGQSAFARCLNLKSVDMPSLESIDYAAFWSCETLESFNGAKLTNVESEAFQACDALKSFDAPLLKELKSSVFAGCKSMQSLSLAVADKIAKDAFRSCENLTTLVLGCTTAIDFDPSYLGSDTKRIDLTLEGVEASNAMGNYWKNAQWNSISSKTGQIKAPVFGVATWGSTKSFVEKAETKSLYGSTGSQLVYKSGAEKWYYTFDREEKFIWGKTEFEYQYDHNSSLVTYPIREFQARLKTMISKYGEPVSKSQDIFSYDPDDTTDSEGHAYWFAKRLMNSSNVYVEYKFKTNEVEVTSTLGYNPNKTKAWGFRIVTTYYPAE